MTGQWIDASLNGGGPYAAKSYFFKGDQYVRYDWASDKAEFGTEPVLRAWKLPPAFAGNFDAALDGRGKYAGKAYFFKAGEYVRYDWKSDSGDAGFPQPLTAWGLPGDFATGITACLNGEGPFEGKAFFFKNDSYVRYDWATERIDAGYPQPLSAWNLPGISVFATGFDACLNGRGSYKGKAYFLKVIPTAAMIGQRTNRIKSHASCSGTGRACWNYWLPGWRRAKRSNGSGRPSRK